ncbi:Ig-like domain-containing protein, partial [Sphingobium sp.]|uniref:Ig-like domain-containing protein n=1 Tax=Sphingobium sp. TaxID=1912891 RepID=UPI0026053ED2
MGEPNARIEIRSVNGVLIGSGMADADGSYAITLDPPLDDGETVQVTQIDAAGNVSAPALAIAPDLTAPVTPDATLDSPTSVSGTGEPGATVTVSDRDGTVLGTAQVGTDGNFTVALSAPQTDGETLSVTQRDAAGNESDPALLVAPDTTAPAAPTATIAGDGLTVTGAGEPGATVRVFGPGGALIGSATVLGDGSYTIVLDEAQTNGQMLTAIQTDNAGNASDPVGLTAPDLDAPLAPVAAITPDGAILSGTGEIGATIEVRDADGTLIGTDTVQPNGSYSITLTPPLIDGESVTVIQIDAAGNGSDPTPIVAPDLTAPEAPTGLIAA